MPIHSFKVQSRLSKEIIYLSPVRQHVAIDDMVDWASTPLSTECHGGTHNFGYAFSSNVDG